MPQLGKVSSLAALLLVAATGTASADEAMEYDDIYEVPRPRAMALQSGSAALQRGVTLYLNRHGGTVTGGWDDASNGSSSIALNAMGQQADVPAYRGGDRRWNQVVSCVRDRFSAFAIDVVTDRPSGDGYTMIMVGGDPSLFNYPSSVGGVAPYTGEVMRGAIGYVFSDNLSNDVETTCTSILHEAGHTFGLDHAYLCEDPMTYLWGCGEKRFQNVDAQCGEGDTRECADGNDTQNSYRHLALHIGLRDERQPEPEPEPQPEPEPEVQQPEPEPDADADDPVWGEGDTTAPSIKILGRDETLPGNQWTEIVVRASDDDELADVELGWASETSEYVISCASPPADMPVSCTRDGNRFTFQLLVGVGMRGMAARATDRSGNQTVTEARLIYFEGE